MKKIISAILAVLIILSVLAGCADKNKITLYAYVGGRATSLDPTLCTTKAEQTYIANLYSGLYSYTYGEDGLPVLVPEDAEDLPDVRVLEGGLYELTFRLKEGLLWSNGEPVTPEDYVYSWNRAAKNLVYTDKSYLFSLIDGYESFVEYEEDAKLNMSYDNGKRSFCVVVKEDSERFLGYTTETPMFPVSRIALRDSDDWDVFAEDFASNGRYTLGSLDKDSLTVVKNERYRDAKNTSADSIKFFFDIDEAEKAYDKGKLTFAKLDTDTSLMLNKTSQTVCASGYISFNGEDSALGAYTDEEKAKIRRAISVYVAISGAFSDGGESEPALVPCLKKGDHLSNMTEEYADSLLADVAATSGRFTSQDGRVYEFPILTAINADREKEQKRWSRIASYLSEQGISLQTVNCTWEEFLLARTNGEYSMLFNSWTYNSLSAGELLSLFRSDSIYNDTMSEVVKGGIYDSAVLVRISDTEKANEKYADALALLEESALVFPVINAYVDFYSSDADKYCLSEDGIVRFK